MLEILGNLNYTAIIITILLCVTIRKVSEQARYIVRCWLEGVKVELEIQRAINQRSVKF